MAFPVPMYGKTKLMFQTTNQKMIEMKLGPMIGHDCTWVRVVCICVHVQRYMHWSAKVVARPVPTLWRIPRATQLGKRSCLQYFVLGITFFDTSRITVSLRYIYIYISNLYSPIFWWSCNQVCQVLINGINKHVWICTTHRPLILTAYMQNLQTTSASFCGGIGWTVCHQLFCWTLWRWRCNTCSSPSLFRFW